MVLGCRGSSGRIDAGLANLTRIKFTHTNPPIFLLLPWYCLGDSAGNGRWWWPVRVPIKLGYRKEPRPDYPVWKLRNAGERDT